MGRPNYSNDQIIAGFGIGPFRAGGIKFGDGTNGTWKKTDTGTLAEDPSREVFKKYFVDLLKKAQSRRGAVITGVSERVLYALMLTGERDLQWLEQYR